MAAVPFHADDPAAKSVFISYARASTRAEATHLHDALRASGVDVFLDSSGLTPGDEVPDGLLDALLRARVVVVFLEPVYFTRWYCVREMLVATEAVRVLSARGIDEADPELVAAQRALVVALGQDTGPGELDRLPPIVSRRLWPRAAEAASLANLVRVGLIQTRETIGDRLERLGALGDLRRQMERELELPPPADLRRVPVYHETGLPDSIRDGFVGRQALMWELHTELTTRRTGPAVAALTGALRGGAGFGKTRLVLEYVHRYGPRHYPGGLFWVNADAAHDRVQAQMHGILCALEPHTPDLQTLRQSGRLVEDELRRAVSVLPRDMSVLYVIDNVPEPRPGERPHRIETWCPVRGLVTLLVTSRASAALFGVRSIQVGVLPPSAAVDLLTYGYVDRQRLDEARWGHIADWVGRLPLALTILNAALRERALSALELAELAERRHADPLATLERHVDALRPLVPEGEVVGITEALQASYERLSPEVQRGARLLAQLSPEPIPLAVLRAFGTDVFTPSVRAMLVARSFVAEAADTPVEAFGGMHRLLAAFLRSESAEMDAEASQASQALARVMTWEACKDPTQWPLLDACRPHAERMFQLGAEGPPERYSEPLITLGANLGHLLRMEGHWRESAAVRGEVLKLATAVLGEEDPRTLVAMGHLAAILRRQGELARSRELAEQVVEASSRILGREHLDTITAVSTLAATLRDLGELRRSRDLAERALAIRVERLGRDNLDTLMAMGNLAATLRRLGQLDRAEALEIHVLEARRRLQGEEHWETLYAMSNLAGTLRARGDLARARDLQERVLDARTRMLGEENSDTLRAMDNLAITLRALGERERALALEERVPEERRTWRDD